MGIDLRAHHRGRCLQSCTEHRHSYSGRDGKQQHVVQLCVEPGNCNIQGGAPPLPQVVSGDVVDPDDRVVCALALRVRDVVDVQLHHRHGWPHGLLIGTAGGARHRRHRPSGAAGGGVGRRAWLGHRRGTGPAGLPRGEVDGGGGAGEEGGAGGGGRAGRSCRRGATAGEVLRPCVAGRVYYSLFSPSPSLSPSLMVVFLAFTQLVGL